MSTLGPAVVDLESTLTTLVTRATTNASLVSSIKSTNNIQNSNIERLTTDLLELEQLARELDTQIMMYEMLVEGLP